MKCTLNSSFTDLYYKDFVKNVCQTKSLFVLIILEAIIGLK